MNLAMNTLYLMDNMAGMAQIPDKFFELALTDPQYGIGEAGKNHKSRNTLVRQKDGKTMRRCPSTSYTRKDWDDAPPSPEYFKELFRVSQNQLIFGANYFESICGTPFKAPRRKEYNDFIERYPTGWIIWDKVNGTSDFSDCELIWTSFDQPTRIVYYMWAGMMQGVSVISGTVMQGDKSKNEKRIHPTQKPTALIRYLLTEHAKTGFKIIDTHVGSGSHPVACEDMGFDWMGFEIDAEYHAAAIKRLQTFRSQTRLFNPKNEAA